MRGTFEFLWKPQKQKHSVIKNDVKTIQFSLTTCLKAMLFERCYDVELFK